MLERVLLFAVSPTTWCILAITLVVICSVQSMLSHPSDMPPMPCLPVPVFGHALYMRPTMLQAISTWRKRVGDIFTLYLAGRPTIILNNYDLLTEAFVKQADCFSDRPLTVRDKIVCTEGGAGIVNNSGKSWKEQRTVTISILRSFGMGKNLMAESVSKEVDVLLDELNALQGEAKDVSTLINASVSDVICALVLGQRFDYDDPIFLRLVKQNADILKLVLPSSLLHPFPWLRFLPGDLFNAKLLYRVVDDLRQLFSRHFIQKFKDNENDTSPDNYIKAYLREKNKREGSGQLTYLDEEQLVRNINNLFIAGTDTTSTTILWALIFAMNHPDVEEKIYKEMREAIGKDRTPTIHDKPKLNYLNAFIMETQRLASITPLSIPHMCSKTTRVHGHTIPEGAIVLPNLDAVLKDPDNWKDADVFRPERFLDENNKLLSPGPFLPFSLGRRVCLGESLAKMELFLFLSAIFHRFQILPEHPDNPPRPDGVFGFTVAPKPFRVRFNERV